MGIQKCSHTHLSIPNHLVLQNGSLTLLVWVVWLEEFWLGASRLPHAPTSSLSQTMHRTIKRSMRELIICLSDLGFMYNPDAVDGFVFSVF